MNRIPRELDLSGAVGASATQIHVGQFDLQFSISKVRFAVLSPVRLLRDGLVIGTWREGRWPDAAFIEVLNARLVDYAIPSDREIVLYFENGIEMHLCDASDQYESMKISFEGETGVWII